MQRSGFRRCRRKARGNDDYTIHLTYPIDEIDELRKEDWEKEQKKEKNRKKKDSNKVVRPDWSPKQHSLRALFDKHAGFEGKVQTVGKTEPHVIDLLDPVTF